MRITVYQKTLMGFLYLIIFFLVVITGSIPSTFAQDEPALIIDLYDSNDWNKEAESVLFEGKTYDVVVSTESESVILNVNITVLGQTYLTSLSEPYITITAPRFEESDSIVIIAIKEGYHTATVEFAVLKGELSIVADKALVEEKKEFQVTVTDQDSRPVEGAFVYVTEDATPVLTDQNGRALVRAPEIDIFNTATIQVIKSGYLPGSTTIRIEAVKGSIFELSDSQFLQLLPILFAILVVIFSIIYVLIRQKRTQKTPAQNKPLDVSDKPHHCPPEKQRFPSKQVRYPEKEKSDLSASSLESRVEEIRIPVQSKKKETTYLSGEKEPEQHREDQKTQQDEWFKGQEYMRYKLDELTGKIDQKTDGRWFEGEQDTKYKVDEALKKNIKKKKIEEDTTK
jgi:hypothetical protein